MRYSIEPRDKSYGFLSFARNIGKHSTKVTKNVAQNMSNRCSQKLVDSAKKSATDAI